MRKLTVRANRWFNARSASPRLLLLGLAISSLLGLRGSHASSLENPDWSAAATIDPRGRPNPYGWDDATWAQKIARGKLHALHYPVSVTGLQMPARPLLRALTLQPGDPFFGFLKAALRMSYDIQHFAGFWEWLGLQDYPIQAPLYTSVSDPMQAADPHWIPIRSDRDVRYPMGVTLAPGRNGAEMVTFSCAACHSATLFGKPLLGLTNRFPRANEFFILGQSATHRVSPAMFRIAAGATLNEQALYAATRERIQAVGLQTPMTLGLDTSLAQVALSLARREPDVWATRSRHFESHPRPNFLDSHVADSKPAVWWNLKYKTRWLSDGSVRSGNPIFTNFIWNEIGRGADLPELEKWMAANREKIEELTTAVFASRAPRWNDDLGTWAPIRIDRARRGAEIFAQACASCHGQYLKDWTRPGLAATETLEVRYHPQTPVRDVGTDANRRQGMRALAEALNPLEISKKSGILIEEQAGYVPPPLEGIWARYPYFHNNSIPNLCALMTPPAQRPVTYWAGQPILPGRDYDLECVGYPVGQLTPPAWKKDPAFQFDTRRPGLSNAGHYEKIFLREGQERWTPNQKRDLIEFLKTL